MKDDVIVFVYKREQIKENNTDDVKNIKLVHYILKPVEIVEGVLKEEDGKKVFSSNDGELNLKSIEDISAIDDEYLFAFPVTVNEYNDEERNETKEYMKEEALFKTFLMQNHSTENEETLNTYAYNSYTKKVLVVINPDDYDESEAVIEYDITDYAEKLEENQFLLFRYSDISRIEKEREEEEEKENAYEELPHKAIKYNKKLIYSDELYDEITKYVLSQDEQIKAIATIFAKNQRINNPYLKNNFILCGPTGVGKSEIFRRISSIAQIPMITEDSSEFTAEGYVGKSLLTVLSHLYDAAGGDLKAAENGIIMMDEIDKKAGSRGANELEVGRTAVIEALLKMIEGHTYEIPVGRQKIYFDTSRVTFAFCGAFSGIEKYANEVDDSEKRLVGFRTINNSEEKKVISPNKLYNFETLRKYGLLPEFLGRNRIIAMNKLTQEDLEKILKESELSYLKLYRDYLKNEMNLEFKYDDEVIKEMAALAIKKGTGARSLTNIAEEMLQEVNFMVGSTKISDYHEVIITKDTVNDPKKYILR